LFPSKFWGDKKLIVIVQKFFTKGGKSHKLAASRGSYFRANDSTVETSWGEKETKVELEASSVNELNR